MKIKWPHSYHGLSIYAQDFDDLRDLIATRVAGDTYSEVKSIARCHQIVGTETDQVTLYVGDMELKMTFREFERRFRDLLF
jgi:hypothetical protein